MSEAEKQLVEQVTGVAISTADMTGMLVRHLASSKSIKPREALKALYSLHAHQKDLESKNQHLPGSAAMYGLIANRLETHIQQLKADTGLKVTVTETLPDGSTRQREI